MHHWSRGFVGTGLFAVAAVGLLLGCADDLYAPCDLDPASPDAAVAACGADDGVDRSCVVDNQLQCDTRSCARYQGSDPFCTQACTSDGDCPGGSCLEIPFQGGRNYCVEASLVE